MGLIAYTGTRGTGKTASAISRALYLKYYYPEESVTTLVQVESQCPFPINEGIGYAARMWIFARQLIQELTLAHQFDLVVSDRTIVDAAAYSLVSGMEGLAMAQLDLAAKHMHIYQDISFKHIANNNFCFDDGHPGTDGVFRQKIEDTLLDMYATLEARGALACRINHT